MVRIQSAGIASVQLMFGGAAVSSPDQLDNNA